MEGGLTVFVALRVALSITMLGYASYRDVKTREISDHVWIIFGAAGLGLNIYEVYTGALGLIPLLAAVGFSTVFALLTGYLGFFGGADLLAFIVMGLLNPVTPFIGFKPLIFSPIFFPLTVISNSVLIGATGVIVVLIFNLTTSRNEGLFHGYVTPSGWKRVILLLTGVNKDAEAVRGPPYEYPLERIGEGDAIYLIVRPNLMDDAGASETLNKLRSMGRTRIWISYSLPFILVLGAGYLSSIMLGDLTLWFVSWFIH
jgi:prepilin signal peptidase PulO-like enzyme (type II secretory pathway)